MALGKQKQAKVFDGKHGAYDNQNAEYGPQSGGTVPKRRKTLSARGRKTSFVEKIQDSDDRHSVVREHIALSFYNTLSAGQDTDHQFAPSARLGLLTREEFEDLLRIYYENGLLCRSNSLTADCVATARGKEPYFESGGEKRYLTFNGKLVEGYSDLGEQFVMSIEAYKTLPEMVEHENNVYPLRGLAQIAALSRILRNNDWLGGSGGNTGYVLKDGVAQAIMVDAGESLPREKDKVNKVPGSFRGFPIGNNSPVVVLFDELSAGQRDEFIGTIYKFLNCEDVVSLLHELVKKGGLYNSKHFSNGQVIETLPDDLADEWVANIMENLAELADTYNEELVEYGNKHSELPEAFSLADFGVELTRAGTTIDMLNHEQLEEAEAEQSSNFLYNLIVAVGVVGLGVSAVANALRNG